MIFKQTQPEVNKVINEDVYVDDGLSGGKSIEEVTKLTDQINSCPASTFMGWYNS